MSTRNLADEDLTNAVLASFDGAKTERFKTIAESLVQHLHAFASEVQLTEEEWFAGIDFLTRTGHITDDKRQEFVLLSDVLGLSMLVVGIEQPAPAGGDRVDGLRPVLRRGLAGVRERRRHRRGLQRRAVLRHRAGGRRGRRAGRGCARRDLAGRRCRVLRRPERRRAASGRGHLFTDEDGRFSFWSVKPEAYPIPADGPVGELLDAGGRGPMRPAHIHFMVTAEGYQRLITHVFAEGDEYLDSDAVFGVRSALIAPFVRDGDHWTMSYDLVAGPP